MSALTENNFQKMKTTWKIYVYDHVYIWTTKTTLRVSNYNSLLVCVSLTLHNYWMGNLLGKCLIMKQHNNTTHPALSAVIILTKQYTFLLWSRCSTGLFEMFSIILIVLLIFATGANTTVTLLKHHEHENHNNNCVNKIFFWFTSLTIFEWKCVIGCSVSKKTKNEKKKFWSEIVFTFSEIQRLC